MRRPHPSLSVTATAVCLNLLAGCAHGPAQPLAAWRIEPTMQVRHALPTAQGYYALGRYHEGSEAWESAIEAYGKAIAAEPAHVEAHNALGVAWARLGRYAAAESALRRGLEIDPARAHLHSNLGYVLLLAGRAEASVSALREAVRLDGRDTVARANLADATSKVSQAASATSAPAPVNDAAVPGPSQPAAATVSPLATFSTATVAALPIDVGATPRSTTPAPVPAEAPVNARLEISNGVGVTGAAARLKQWLGTMGMPTHRLTNQPPYQQRETVVQYRRGHEAAAMRIAKMLGVAAPLESASGLRSEIRVVIGRDLPGSRPDAAMAKLAAAD